MQTLTFIWTALVEVFNLMMQFSEDIAFNITRVSSLDSRGRPREPATVVLRGLTILALILIAVIVGLIGLGLYIDDPSYRSWTLLVAVMLGGVVLIPMFLMTAFVPVLGWLITQAGKLPDAGVLEEVGDSIPVAKLWVTSFMWILLSLTLLASLLSTGIAHNDLSLFPILLIVGIALAISIAIGRGARVVTRISLTGIVVILSLWVIPEVRDCYYNEVCLDIFSSTADMAERDGIAGAHAQVAQSANKADLKDKLRLGDPKTDSWGDVYAQLIHLCAGDTDCILEAQDLRVELEKKSVKTLPVSSGSNTSANTSSPTPIGLSERYLEILKELPYMTDKATVREKAAFYAFNGQIDEQLKSRYYELGGNFEGWSQVIKDRSVARFGEVRGAATISKHVFGTEWSELLSFKRGCRDAFLFVDGRGGKRKWDILVDENTLISNAQGARDHCRNLINSNNIQIRLNAEDSESWRDGTVWIIEGAR